MLESSMVYCMVADNLPNNMGVLTGPWTGELENATLPNNDDIATECCRS